MWEIDKAGSGINVSSATGLLMNFDVRPLFSVLIAAQTAVSVLFSVVRLA